MLFDFYKYVLIMSQMAGKTVEASDTTVVKESDSPGRLVYQKMSELMFESGLGEQDKVAIILGLIDKMSDNKGENPPIFTRDQSEEIIDVIRDITRDNYRNTSRSSHQ